MNENNIGILKESIEKQHAGDTKQLEVIFSEENRVLVEAPAGYGKTTTMVSRIAYLLAKEEIPNPKKILALTFSVNAALKIKRDIAEKLPAIMGVENNPVSLTDKITATNYHGFCKTVLANHGFLLDSNLKRDINSFKAIGDDKIDKNDEVILDSNEIDLCNKIESTVKGGLLPNEEEIDEYLNIVKNKLLPLNYITHNSELFFTLKLFTRYPDIIKFYRNLYVLIIVDEFQDTNIIAWKLIQSLIGESTKLLFLGDPLQRIYGFIGALPNVMGLAMDEYNMKKIILNQNYRFKDNIEMLKLDHNIRLNAQSLLQGIGVTENADLLGYWGENQIDEAKQVVKAVCNLQTVHPEKKIALLCRGRGDNASVIEDELLAQNVDYFYGMFKDDDEEYIGFHAKCHQLLLKRFGKKLSVNNVQLKRFTTEIKAVYGDSTNKAINSLLELLDALQEKVATDYAMLSPEDKYLLLLDIFENRQLRQSMEYIKCNVILATVHGAKGLEWDYVFLPDLEQWGFPGYPTCSLCDGKNHTGGSKCNFIYSNAVEKSIIEEISVFYVGITRARKQVFVSASAKRANNKDGKYSCFSSMPGIKLVQSTV